VQIAHTPVTIATIRGALAFSRGRCIAGKALRMATPTADCFADSQLIVPSLPRIELHVSLLRTIEIPCRQCVTVAVAARLIHIEPHCRVAESAVLCDGVHDEVRQRSSMNVWFGHIAVANVLGRTPVSHIRLLITIGYRTCGRRCLWHRAAWSALLIWCIGSHCALVERCLTLAMAAQHDCLRILAGRPIGPTCIAPLYRSAKST